MYRSIFRGNKRNMITLFFKKISTDIRKFFEVGTLKFFCETSKKILSLRLKIFISQKKKKNSERKLFYVSSVESSLLKHKKFF